MENGRAANREKLFVKALRGRQQVYNLIGLNSMGLSDCERALSFCRTNIRSRSMESELLLDLAESLRIQNEYEAAKKVTTEALQYLDRKKSKNEFARCLNLLGMVNDETGDYDSTLHYYQQALSLNEETQNKSGIASGANNIGLHYWGKGELGRALSYFQKALKTWKEANNRMGIGVASGNLGLAYCSMGDLNTALKYFSQNLQVSEEINHKLRIVIALGNVGAVYGEKGEFEKARALYQRALELSTEMGNQYEIAFAHLYLGDADYERGDLPEAKKHLEKAKKTFREMGDFINLASVFIALAAVHRKAKDYNLSLECAQEALALSERVGAKEQEVGALREIAKTVSKEDYEKAIPYLEKSISIAKEEEMQLQVAKSSFALAKIFRALGKKKNAEELRNQARTIFKKAGAEPWLERLDSWS